MQSDEITMNSHLQVSGKAGMPAVPGLSDCELNALHDSVILLLMFHEFQKHFVLLVIKSVGAEGDKKVGFNTFEALQCFTPHNIYVYSARSSIDTW